MPVSFQPRGQAREFVRKLQCGKLAKIWIKKALTVERAIYQRKIDEAKKEGQPYEHLERTMPVVPAKWEDISDHCIGRCGVL